MVKGLSLRMLNTQEYPKLRSRAPALEVIRVMGYYSIAPFATAVDSTPSILTRSKLAGFTGQAYLLEPVQRVRLAITISGSPMRMSMTTAMLGSGWVGVTEANGRGPTVSAMSILVTARSTTIRGSISMIKPAMEFF